MRTLMLMLSSAVVIGCVPTGAASRERSPAQRPAQTQGTPVNADAQLLADFKSRVDKYMEVHERAKKGAPPLKETRNPAEIKASQDAMARQIREARSGAGQGEIFTPEIRQLFRRLMYPETKGSQGAETKAAVNEEKHELKDVVLKVNAAYPDTAPLMTVPPNILAALPRLPEALEYRFVMRHMILLDVHANLIVDFVTNAIQ